MKPPELRRRRGWPISRATLAAVGASVIGGGLVVGCGGGEQPQPDEDRQAAEEPPAERPDPEPRGSLHCVRAFAASPHDYAGDEHGDGARKASDDG